MALKNRLGTAVYSYKDEEGDVSTIKLQSSLANLQSLKEDTGKDFYDFMDSCTTPQQVAKMFYHMQHGSEYDEDEIYAAFFADLGVFQNATTQEQLQDVIYVLMGVDKAQLIKPLPTTQKKKAS